MRNRVKGSGEFFWSRSIEGRSIPNPNMQSAFLALRVIIVKEIVPAVMFAVIGRAARQLFH